MSRKPTPSYAEMAERIHEQHGHFIITGVKEGINGQDLSTQPYFLLECTEHDPPHTRQIRPNELSKLNGCAGQDYPTKINRGGSITRSRNIAYKHIETYLFQEMGDHIVTGIGWEPPTDLDDPPFDVKLIIHCLKCRKEFRIFQSNWKSDNHICGNPCIAPKRNGNVIL